MALNLNKSSEGTSSSEPKKGFNLSKSGESNLPDENKLQSNGSDQKQAPNTSKRNMKYIIAMIIVVIAFIVYKSFSGENGTTGPTGVDTVVSKNPGNSVTTDTNQAPVEVDQNTTAANPAENTTSNGSVEAVNSTNSSGSSSGNATTEKSSVENSSNKNSSTSSPNNATNAISNQGTLEEKAKEVISGKYGNGNERKNALGNGYNEIQSKVNELLKQAGN